MKCQVCGEVFIGHFNLHSHFYEKHVMPTWPALEKLYSSTGNTWSTQTPRMALNNSRPGLAPLRMQPILVYTNNNLKSNGTSKPDTELMTGNGMLNNESRRVPKNYTHEELRAILRFHKSLNK